MASLCHPLFVTLVLGSGVGLQCLWGHTCSPQCSTFYSSDLVIVSFPLLFSPLFPSPLYCQHFLPLLKYVFTEMPPALLMGSAVSCDGSISELAETRQTLTSSHSAAPSATKTLPPTANTRTQPLHYFLHRRVLCGRFYP